MKKLGRVLIFLVLIVCMTTASVHAGGLWLYEEATPDMGVGGAGRQAAGFDASTAGGNPAAMTRLDRSQVEGGSMGIYPDTQWAGIYYVQRASFTTAAVNPTIGYRIAPWLSVGGGVSAVQGSLSERVAVNTLLEPGDGRLKYDASDVGYGYNLGVLFEMSPQTRLGVTYVSQVNLDFKDELRFKNLDGTILGAALNASGLLDAQLKINVNLPAQLAVGAYHSLTDKLALVGTVNWQNWSRFGQPEISVADSNTVTDDLGYKDTYHAGIGVYYRVADPWLLMAGFGYDTSPTSSSSERSPVLPLGAQFRYATGVQYDWSKDFSIGAAYTLIDAGSAKINQSGGPLRGDLEGEYDTNFIHAFNVNFVYRF